MEKSYKFRLYPTPSQVDVIERTFGHCRYVWNYYLDFRTKLYDVKGEQMGYNSMSADMTKLKKQNTWLKEADCSALQNSLKDLDMAYKRFFKQTSDYPSFKSKKLNRNSYRSSAAYIELSGNRVKLPKLGYVECRVSKQPEGRIISATVSKTPSGKYYVALCCTDVTSRELPKTGNAAVAEVQSSEDYETKRVKRLRRSLARKTIGGSNWDKTRRKLAQELERQVNRRLDEFHKLSTQLVAENDIIELKTELPSELKDQLTYKARWYGKQLMAS